MIKVEASFHPLKAGRRHLWSRWVVWLPLPVSIPSRRVGDAKEIVAQQYGLTEFPSPQGGSETLQHLARNEKPHRRFHPLKAGRRPFDQFKRYEGDFKFPSPQGGSETNLLGLTLTTSLRFHPLKAGRRLHLGDGGDDIGVQFPSPQGGSETVTCRWMPEYTITVFPSPQGGSETTMKF